MPIKIELSITFQWMISIVSDEGPYVEKGQTISKKDYFQNLSKKNHLRFQYVPNMTLVAWQINEVC